MNRFEVGPIARSSWAKRHKRCAFCDVEYCDITRRFVGRTCSDDCFYNLMVRTRHENGSYERTEEQNEKLSSTLRKMYANGHRLSDEARLKMSISSKGKNSGPKPNHWTKTPEGRERVRRMSTGRIFSDEARRRMSQGHARFMRENPNHAYTRGKGGYREDLGMYFRSRWEANYARYLTFTGKTWKYEPAILELLDGTQYIPDFSVDDTEIHEVKGFMTESGARKIEGFGRDYPGVPFKLIDAVEYASIEKAYATQIPNWEHKR